MRKELCEAGLKSSIRFSEPESPSRCRERRGKMLAKSAEEKYCCICKFACYLSMVSHITNVRHGTKQGTSDILGKMSFCYCKKHTFNFNLIPRSKSYSSYFFRCDHLYGRPFFPFFKFLNAVRNYMEDIKKNLKIDKSNMNFVQFTSVF